MTTPSGSWGYPCDHFFVASMRTGTQAPEWTFHCEVFVSFATAHHGQISPPDPGGGRKRVEMNGSGHNVIFTRDMPMKSLMNAQIRALTMRQSEAD